MSFWQKLFSANQQHNEHKNHSCCVENDYSCRCNEELLQELVQETDQDVVLGIKRILISRGYTRKELLELLNKKPVQ